MVDFMYNVMFKHSDIILTHSRSGIEFAEEKYPSFAEKITYFVHPVKYLFNIPPKQKRIYDIFIWGTIWPYKGVIEFLEFLKASGQTHLKVLIAGRCINEKVQSMLENNLTDNTDYLNNFFEIGEIAKLANKARFTLFTYNTESVLSSGSLMDSVGMRSVIIGPDAGAFKDLSLYGFVYTYKTFDNIIEILKDHRSDFSTHLIEIEAFCNNNSWELFGEKLCSLLHSNLEL